MTSISPARMGAGTGLAGLALASVGAVFMTVIMLGSSIASGYDGAGGAISDLGINPATAALFNWTLLTVGVLNIVGGLLLFRALPHVDLPIVALLAGLGAIGAGLFPLDRGDVHGLSALFAFLFFNIQTALTALRSRGLLRVVGSALALVGLAYVVIMVIGDSGTPAVFGAIGHGGSERMIVYPPMIWLMIFGGSLMAR